MNLNGNGFTPFDFGGGAHSLGPPSLLNPSAIGVIVFAASPRCQFPSQSGDKLRITRLEGPQRTKWIA